MDRPYRKLIDRPDLEIPVPSRESVLGFVAVLAIAAMMVVGLLVFVWWMKG